jgi:hypothetical protein
MKAMLTLAALGAAGLFFWKIFWPVFLPFFAGMFAFFMKLAALAAFAWFVWWLYQRWSEGRSGPA